MEQVELRHMASDVAAAVVQGLREEGSGGEMGVESQQLEQADGGVVAWRNLIAAFMFEALLWGKYRNPLRSIISIFKFPTLWI